MNDNEAAMLGATSRYFVDERAGCIAVRDRTLTDPEYQGLHSETPGVVKYWNGEQLGGEPCPTCGRSGSGRWFVPLQSQKEAQMFCAEMNAKGENEDVT
jgi:hypothetical protein